MGLVKNQVGVGMVDAANLLEEARQGNRRSLAKLLTYLEEGGKSPLEYGRGKSLGITGPPGVGKSSLIGKLIDEWLNLGETVAVLAVDPSSPISGGALLGDRMRMVNADSSDSVFVRSLATRNHPGGLMNCLTPMIEVLSECGWENIVIETVGSGQSETRVVAFADIVVLVDGPDRGDIIQAEKSGIIEMADLIVINKSDLKNAQKAADSIRSALSFNEESPKVFLSSAHTGEGIKEIINELKILQSPLIRNRMRVRERLISAWDSVLLESESLEILISEIEDGKISISEAIEMIRNHNKTSKS